VEVGRELVKAILGLPWSPSPAFYLTYVEMEMACDLANDQVSRQNIRNSFERTLAPSTTAYTATEIWLRYLQWEKRCGCHDKAAIVYQRALKALPHPSAFIEKCTLQRLQ